MINEFSKAKTRFRIAADCHEVVEYEMYSSVMLVLSPQPL